MAPRLTVLYRGPLASCNYDCGYCPFAKRQETAAELVSDRRGLERLRRWIQTHTDTTFSLFFTPWGEALTRPWYRRLLVELSRQPHVEKVVAQTNLSGPLDWVTEANRRRVALWCTYHPSQARRQAFLDQCLRLDELGVRYSVGVVGMKEYFDEIEALRRCLPPHVYLWVNAYKSSGRYYDAGEVRRLESVDPLFAINSVHHPSCGQWCRTGETVISVDGDGEIRRCHFVEKVLGNIDDPDWRQALQPRRCPNETCGCHIGYVHLRDLRLDDTFGDGILERIPQRPLTAEWETAVSRLRANSLS